MIYVILSCALAQTPRDSIVMSKYGNFWMTNPNQAPLIGVGSPGAHPALPVAYVYWLVGALNRTA